MSYKIYIGGISSTAGPKDIEDYFSRFGSTSNIEFKNTYCFLEYDNPTSCQDALREMHGKEFLGSILRVELAHAFRASSSTKYETSEPHNSIQKDLASSIQRRENSRWEPRDSRTDYNPAHPKNKEDLRRPRLTKDKNPCFNCGGVGHWVRDCPSAPRSARGDTQLRNEHSRESHLDLRRDDYRRPKASSRERSYDPRRVERDGRSASRYDRYVPSQPHNPPIHDRPSRYDSYPDRYERPSDFGYHRDRRSYSRPNYRDSNKGYSGREYPPAYPPSERDGYYNRDSDYARERYERERALAERDQHRSYSQSYRPTSSPRMSPPHHSQRFSRDYPPEHRPRTPPKPYDTDYGRVHDFSHGRERRDDSRSARRRSRSPLDRTQRNQPSLEHDSRRRNDLSCTNSHSQIVKGPRTPSPPHH